MSNANSAFGSIATVQAITENPQWLQDHIASSVEGNFLEEALFRDAGQNDGVVVYREAAAAFLAEGPETVAEYAEIPTSNLETGDVKSIIASKTAEGVYISREMIRGNRLTEVTAQTQALKNSFYRNSTLSTIESLNVDGINTVAASGEWEDPNSNPLKDLRIAKQLISTAHDDKNTAALFGYMADTIVCNPAVIDLAIENERTQKFYNAVPALENPAFNGEQPAVLHGLRIITSPFIPESEAYVLQSKTAGFYSDADPFTVTDLYEPFGSNGFGGTRQAYRIDAFQSRIKAVDAPKAVTKITGITK